MTSTSRRKRDRSAYEKRREEMIQAQQAAHAERYKHYRPPAPAVPKKKLTATERAELLKYSYWNSSEAQVLFKPRDNETIQQAMSRRIGLFENVIQDPTRFRNLLEQGTPEQGLTAAHGHQILVSCLVMRKAYVLLRDNKAKGMGWQQACHEAVEIVRGLGFKCAEGTWVGRTHKKFIMNNEKFANPVRPKKPLQDPHLFRAHPVAKKMLIDFCDEYVTGVEDGYVVLENVTFREINNYFTKIIVPTIHKQYNDEMEATDGGKAVPSQVDFLKMYNLTGSKRPRVTTDTIYRWVTTLGYKTKRDYKLCTNTKRVPDEWDEE